MVNEPEISLFVSPACLYRHPFLGLRLPQVHPPVPLGPPHLWDQEDHPHPKGKRGLTKNLDRVLTACYWLLFHLS